MPKTTGLALPDSAIIRISNRLRDIQPDRDWSPAHANTMYLPAAPASGAFMIVSDNFEDLLAAGYQLWQECDMVLFTIAPTTGFQILTEVRTASTEDTADTARLFDQRDLEALRSEEQADAKYEWDEYPEPLWDPLKSEVQLLVRQYFEQADADSD